MTGFETIRYEVRDGLAEIVLARPEKRNAVNAAMFAELAAATERAWDDGGVRAVLVRGDGPTFCSGIDQGLLGDLATIAGLGREFGAFVENAQRPFRALAAMPKPTLAAVQGHAVGAGFQLALACDLRLAADDARFGMLEPRYGLVPDLGGPHRLARLVGPARAKEAIWTTRLVDAEEALRIGLVERVVPAGELVAEADATGRAIRQHSPITLGLVKSLVESASESSLDEHLRQAAEAQAVCIRSNDHREAVSAFLEKRSPRFTGT